MMMMMMMMLMVMVIMNSPRAPICFLFAEALVKESHQEIASTISEASLPSGKISTPKKKTKSSVRGDVFVDKGANTHMETTSPGRREMPWLRGAFQGEKPKIIRFHSLNFAENLG